MSCLFQCVRSEVDVEEKTEVETITPEQSLILVRNLIRTSISTICYLRALFPESCFYDKELNGLNIKALSASTEEAVLLRNWVELGIFDALGKRYLRKIIFGIYSDPECQESLVECYAFNVSYPDDERISMSMDRTKDKQRPFQSSAMTKAEVRQSTTQMIRTIILLCETLDRLPAQRFLSIKLLYYDEVTPREYEPEFFRAVADRDQLLFKSDPVSFKLGSFRTNSHTLSLRIKTAVDSFNEKSLITTPRVTVEDGEEQEPEEEPLRNLPCSNVEELTNERVEDSLLEQEASDKAADSRGGAELPTGKGDAVRVDENVILCEDSEERRILSLFTAGLDYLRGVDMLKRVSFADALGIPVSLANPLIDRFVQDGCLIPAYGHGFRVVASAVAEKSPSSFMGHEKLRSRRVVKSKDADLDGEVVERWTNRSLDDVPKDIQGPTRTPKIVARPLDKVRRPISNRKVLRGQQSPDKFGWFQLPERRRFPSQFEELRLCPPDGALVQLKMKVGRVFETSFRNLEAFLYKEEMVALARFVGARVNMVESKHAIAPRIAAFIGLSHLNEPPDFDEALLRSFCSYFSISISQSGVEGMLQQMASLRRAQLESCCAALGIPLLHGSSSCSKRAIVDLLLDSFSRISPKGNGPVIGESADDFASDGHLQKRIRRLDDRSSLSGSRGAVSRKPHLQSPTGSTFSPSPQSMDLCFLKESPSQSQMSLGIKCSVVETPIEQRINASELLNARVLAAYEE